MIATIGNIVKNKIGYFVLRFILILFENYFKIDKTLNIKFY